MIFHQGGSGMRHVESRSSQCFRPGGAVVLWLAAVCATSHAQINTTGVINGSVSDATGAAIVGAKVSITNTATGAAMETVSNSAGSFSQVGLTAGQYEVAVSNHGFSTFKETGISLESVGAYTVNAVLKVGAESAAVTVSASAAVIQTTSAEVSSTVSAEEAEALPLNGRDYQGLGSLMPGVYNNSPVAGLGTGGFNTTNALSVNGQGLGGSLYLLDGVWNTSSANHNQTNIMPNPDSIAEVKVLQNNYDAKYTLMGSGVIMVQTKSGSDNFHGGLWEFFRNTALDDRNYFSPTVPPEHQNIFGWQLGGPVFIPHLYSRNNHKSFFYYNQQIVKLESQSVINGAAPTAAMRSGVFPGAIKDPNGGVFPNNTIPTARINPNSIALLSALDPLPNYITSAFNNYVNTNPAITDQDNIEVKVDHNLSSKLRLNGEYIRERQDAHDPSASRMGSPFNLNWDAYDTHNHLANFQITQILTPSMTNQVTLATSKFDEDHDFAGIHLLSQVPGYSESLPFSGGYLQNYVPLVTLSGGWSEFGASSCCVIPHIKNRVDSLTNDWAWLRGKHFLSAGATLLLGTQRANAGGSGLTNGQFGFNGNFTGNSIADFLLGDAATFSQSSSNYRKYLTYTLASPYFEDQWKATRRLTLSAGLRFLFTPWSNVQQGYTASFDPGHFNPADAPVVAANGQITATPGYNPGNGIVINGENGIPLNLNHAHQYHWAPVIGFALDVFGNGRSALRGGYGITYAQTPEAGCAQNCINYPLTKSLNLVNPRFPNPSGGLAAPATAPSASGADLHNDQAAQVQSYSLSWQQQIASRWFISVAGAGNIGRHLPGGPLAGANIDLNQPGPVPGYNFNPLLNTGNYSNAYFAPYQGYNAITYYTSFGKSSWNALLVSVRHPVGDNLYLTVAYTWSHNLTNMNSVQNMYNPNSSYGNSTSNTPQVLTFSLIYTEPWLKGSTGWKQAVLSGWKLSDMTTIQTGSSLNLGLSTSHNGLATRPDLIGPVTDPHTMLQWFSTKSFAQPAPGFFGNAGVGTLLSPGLWVFNMAAYKDFRMAERLTLQFRGEFFNAFNHPNFGSPNTSFGAGSFGQISSMKNPRIGELALKLRF